MDNRKWLAAADAAAPVVPAVPSAGYPRDTGAPTLPGAFWYHSIGEELRAVIAAGGLIPATASLTQLRDAILTLIGGTSKAIVLDAQAFSGGVANGDAVRWNAAGPNWVKAIADGTVNDLSVGIADVTNSKVFMFGLTTGLFAGLTAGARYYLSSVTAGAITTVAPLDAVYVGIARSATELFADFDVAPVASSGAPPGWKSGLTLSNNGGTQLDIAPGLARDFADAYNLKLAAVLTKTLQNAGAFAVGTGNNGLFSGARTANTWYHFFLIRRDSDGLIDGGFDTSFSAANRPAGWSNYARIGPVFCNAGATIRAFKQFGRIFWWDDPAIDVTVTVDNSAGVLAAIAVPPGVPVAAHVVYGVYQGATAGGYAGGWLTVSPPAIADPAVVRYASNRGWGVEGGAATVAMFKDRIVTNSAAQVRLRYFVSAASDLSTLGWEEI